MYPMWWNIMKLFLDDKRISFKGFQLVTNYQDCIKLLDTKTIEIISLDHDLGTKKSGYDVALYMVQNDIYPKFIYIHTANPVGAHNIYQLLDHYAPKDVKIQIINYLDIK